MAKKRKSAKTYRILNIEELKLFGISNEMWSFFVDFFEDRKALSDFSEILRNQEKYKNSPRLCSQEHKFLHFLLPDRFKIEYSDFYNFLEEKAGKGEIKKLRSEEIQKIDQLCGILNERDIIKITKDQKKLYKKYRILTREEKELLEDSAYLKIKIREDLIENLIKKILDILEIPVEVLMDGEYLNVTFTDKFTKTMGIIEEIPTGLGEWAKFKIKLNAILLFIDIEDEICKEFFTEVIVHEIVHIEHFQHNNAFKRLVEKIMREMGYDSFKCVFGTCINADPWI